MAAVFFMVTMTLYFTATMAFFALLLRRAEALSTVALSITATGFATHTLALVARMVGTTASPPSFQEALSFFSWMLILVFLAVEYRRQIHVGIGVREMPTHGCDIAHAHIGKRLQCARKDGRVALHRRRALERRQRRHRANAQRAIGPRLNIRVTLLH